MNCQIILVISSPSSSTTGFSTLILDMPLCSFRTPASLPGGCCGAALPAAAPDPASRGRTARSRPGLTRSGLHREDQSRHEEADAERGECGRVGQAPPPAEQTCPELW